MQKGEIRAFGYFGVIVFLAYATWWFLLRYTSSLPAGLNGDAFSDTYGLMALIGGSAGILVARKWGGFKSLMGKALMFFSLGLLAQAFGQAVYSVYYFLLDQEIPYPSIGDVGYFGSVLIYIYATYCVAKVAGAHFKLKSIWSKLLVLAVPGGLLGFSYYMFLRGYERGDSSIIATILDFGYPLGQAVYIAIALLAFLLSAQILGGVMRGRILLLILALLVQYVADFVFLYQANRETWVAGGINDGIYLLAYFLMTVSLIWIGKAYLEVQK